MRKQTPSIKAVKGSIENRALATKTSSSKSSQASPPASRKRSIKPKLAAKETNPNPYTYTHSASDNEGVTGIIFSPMAISKQDRLVLLLRKPEGVTLAKLMEVTGWQAHSVRGYISGTLRKKRGLVIESKVLDGKRSYHLITPASTQP